MEMRDTPVTAGKGDVIYDPWEREHTVKRTDFEQAFITKMKGDMW